MRNYYFFVFNLFNLAIMKPFNLELTKKNHPIQTRDGNSVKIICYDRKHPKYPIVALINYGDSVTEDIEEYTINGISCNYSPQADLVMAPTKKEGWINIYKCIAGGYEYESDSYIYDSAEEAKECKRNDGSYITTIKIEWEE